MRATLLAAAAARDEDLRAKFVSPLHVLMFALHVIGSRREGLNMLVACDWACADHVNSCWESLMLRFMAAARGRGPDSDSDSSGDWYLPELT